MSSAETIKVVDGQERKIAAGGGSKLFYLPKETGDYLQIGDTIVLSVIIEGNELKIVGTKQLFYFGVKQIRDLIKEFGFETKYDKNVENIVVLDAAKGNLSLNYTQNLHKKIEQAHITVAVELNNVSYGSYKKISRLGAQLGKFNVIIRPQGDLDTINLLKDSGHYKLDGKKAFEVLKKAGKKIGVSVVLRFNNKQNEIEDVRAGIVELSKLNSKL
ncbi:MAG TPA: hypothetical protein VGA92_05285 [Candidatus Nitrosotenuis sp.]